MAWGRDTAKVQNNVAQALNALGLNRQQPADAAEDAAAPRLANAMEAGPPHPAAADLPHPPGPAGNAAIQTSLDSTMLVRPDIQVIGPQQAQVVDVPLVTRIVQLDAQGTPLAPQLQAMAEAQAHAAGGGPPQMHAQLTEGAAPVIGASADDVASGAAERGSKLRPGDRLLAKAGLELPSMRVAARSGGEAADVADRLGAAIRALGNLGRRV